MTKIIDLWELFAIFTTFVKTKLQITTHFTMDRLEFLKRLGMLAAGAALGVVGIASYIGAGLQDIMNGVLIEGNKTVVNGADVYDFTYVNCFWIGSAIVSLLLTLLVWNAKRNED